MKKVILLLVAVSTLAFTSCNKEDEIAKNNPDVEKTQAELLIGKWKIFSHDNGEQKKELNDCSNKTWVEFKAKTYTYKEYFIKDEECMDQEKIKDYKVEEDKIKTDSKTAMTFKVVGNKVTLKIGEETLVFTRM